MSDFMERLAAIAAANRLTLTELRGKVRSMALNKARRECYRYLHNDRGWSYRRIGLLFNRDWSTVRFSIHGEHDVRRARHRDYVRNRRIARKLSAQGAST